MDRTEEKAKLQNYSLKVLMGGEGEGDSYAGIRLNGAALQALSDGAYSANAEKESWDRLVLKLALHESLNAMAASLGEYAEKLRLEIAGLEVERDQAAAELGQIGKELAHAREQLVAAREAIERIEAGGELVLGGSGTRLKDPALEKLISGYEKRNGVKVDRGDTAYLLAVLSAEEQELAQVEVELEKSRNSVTGRLDEIEARLSEKRTQLQETEELLEAIDQIGLIADEVEHEARLSALLDETPDHILDAMANSDSMPDGLKAQISEMLESRDDEKNAADAFLDDILSEEFDAEVPGASPVPPKVG